MDHTQTYLQTIGIKAQPGESLPKALLRHAAQYNWKPATVNKHLGRLLARHPEQTSGFDDLGQLNSWLAKLGLEPQPTRTRAADALRAVHINLLDLLAERPDRRWATVRELRRYSVEQGLVYPLEAAKRSGEGLRAFLRPLGGRARQAAG
jgi:hypothetical protein